MYASKPTDAKTPESTGRLLLIIGTALALVDGLLYVVGQLGTRYIQPKLHALRIFARSFALFLRLRPFTRKPTRCRPSPPTRHSLSPGALTVK